MNSLFPGLLYIAAVRGRKIIPFLKKIPPPPTSMPFHNPSFLGGFEMEFLCVVLVDLDFAA